MATNKIKETLGRWDEDEFGNAESNKNRSGK